MRYPLIVIGAGAGGLVIAIGAAKAGKKVLLIERGHWGGDCTNFGCIPSKSIIASAHAAHAIRQGAKWGIRAECIKPNATESLARVRTIVSEVRSHEDPAALEKAGVNTLEGTASFLDSHTLQVANPGKEPVIVSGKKIVIATGSSPTIPPIAGLEGTPYLTNETIFALKEIPKSLIVMGGGPIGCELAQAMRRLGSEVIVLAHHALLVKEEKEAQDLILATFKNEGIEVHLECKTHTVRYTNGQFSLLIESMYSSEKKEISAEHLLISTGRHPNLEALKLPAAGVSYSENGIPTDRYGRTSQTHIFAVGDVTGKSLFTHAAEHEARAVLTSLLLPFNKKQDQQPIPRVTFTDPEVASIGMSEKQAEQCYGAKKLAVYTLPFTAVDRAIAEGRTEGFIKVVTKKWSSKILGATIVGPRAGEMLMQISTAMYGKIPFRKLASIIHPYPIYNQAVRKAADLWLTQTIRNLL